MLSERAGPVITGCLAVSAVLLIPQAFVHASWPLFGWRFLMGLSLGGLLPCMLMACGAFFNWRARRQSARSLTP